MSQNIINNFTEIVNSIKNNKYNSALYGINRHTFSTHSYVELAIINEIYRRSISAYTSQHINLKDAIIKPLYAHQTALVAVMQEREKQLREGMQIGTHETFWSQYAFLGDSIGSGKTLTVLAYIASIRGKQYIAKPTVHETSNTLIHSVYRKPMEQQQKYGRLIIVPHTLYRQWESTIKTDTRLNILCCKSVATFRNPKLAEEIVAADAVLVSNTLYQQLQDFAFSQHIRWSQLFIDEPDTIYLASTRTPLEHTADFIWFITGTWASFNINSFPYFFMNRHIVSADPSIPSIQMRQLLLPYLDEEFAQIVNEQFQGIGFQHIHSRGFFQKYITEHPQRYNLIVRCRDSFRQESMKLPPIIMEIIRCRPSAAQRILNDFLKPEVQLLLHAGDITGALAALGVEKESHCDLITAVTDNQQKELIRLKATYEFKQSVEYATPQAKDTALTHLQEKIRSLEEQIASFKERISNISGVVCPICYDEPASKETIVVPCCRQIYCGECILRTLIIRGTCAMCRQELKAGDLHRVLQPGENSKKADRQEQQAAPAQQLSKSQQLLQILQDNPTGKILVFSRYENPFYEIQQELQQHNITVAIVQGNKDVIHSILERFRCGQIRVLLMSDYSVYSGLNLQDATHVIFYHGRMTSGEETQIIGRAQRLGRTTSLRVIKLLHPNEENGQLIAPAPPLNVE